MENEAVNVPVSQPEGDNMQVKVLQVPEGSIAFAPTNPDNINSNFRSALESARTAMAQGEPGQWNR